MTLPPGPRLPRPLQALGWSQRPLPFLERCRKRYGDAFMLRIMHWGDWVVLADPADIKSVFTAGDAVGVDVANPLLGPVLGSRSVMLMEEPEHLGRRRLMLPSFHGAAVAADAQMMVTVARREVGRWPVAEPIELWPRMQEISQEVVLRAVFGPGEEPRLKRLRELLRGLTTWLNSSRNLALLAVLGPDAMVRSPGYRRAMRPLEEAVLAEARRRRELDEPSSPDVVSMLAAARYEDGSSMSERDLRDELVTLITDGPTSSTLAWTFERLLRNPEVLVRLQQDLREGDGAYLDAVVKETLRLCPPVPVIVRRLLRPMTLAGHELPAGMTVAPCPHLVHDDERIYPEPRRFRPERFLEQPPSTYTWIPFGGGIRRCLAASYAEMEIKQVVRTVLETVDLSLVESGNGAVKKSAISFGPSRRGLVVATPCARQRGARRQREP